MKAKTISKRVLSIILCTVMLFSCWVFTAPAPATAATAGSYTWRVYVYSRNDTGGWNSEQLKVYGKSNNGTGSSEDTLLTVNNWKIDFKGERTNTFGKNNQTTSQFPTKIYYAYDFGGGVSHRKLDADIYLQLYYNNTWNTIAGGTVYSYEWGTNSGSKTWSVDSSKFPKADSISAITGGDDSVTLNTNGTDKYSSAYTCGTVKDQYGVNWYQDATLGLNSSYTGVSISSNKLKLTSSANRSNNYTVTLKESCGNASNTRNVTINVFDYKVTFYDEDGSTVLKDEQTIDYGKSADAPSSPTKAYTDTQHFTFDKWTGDTYQNITSGKQTRAVKASYKAANHTYGNTTITFGEGWETATAKKTCSGCSSIQTGKCTVTTEVTKQANCTEEGNTKYTATSPFSGDNTTEIHNETIPINPNAHAWQRYESCDEEHISALDTFVPVVFECANGCGKYCASTYNNGDGKYEPNENYTATTPTDSTLGGNSEKIPTPTFNNDCTEYFGKDEYNYNQRLASLRVRQSEINDPTQAMRFSGNLETYRFSEAAQGVNVYGCDPEKVFNSNEELMSLEEIRNNAANFDDNTVIDFGFVYTQARFIIKDGTTNVLDYDKMLLDHENNRIYRMSVVGNNKGNGTLNSNWQGFTDCANDTESSAGNDQFTFNLVINVNQKNYQAVYCARTYVVYKFRGDIIVMYDKPSKDYDNIMRYSHDSVFNQAEKNLAKQPPESIRNYLNYKIIDITDSTSPRYVEQKNPDWDTAYKVKEELPQS